VVLPHFHCAHLFGSRLDDLSFLRSVIFNLTSAVLDESEQACWSQSARSRNSCDLSAQVSFLSFEIERVCEHLAVDLTSDADLNVSALDYLAWLDV